MKLLVFLADGFEEIEALTVVDYLKRIDINADLVSIYDRKNIIGAHEIEVVANKKIQDINIGDYDGVIIPGGLPGATNLQKDKNVLDIVKEMNKNEKLIGSICAGPIVLEEAGIIKGRKVTSYPGFEQELKSAEYLEEQVVIDKNIITSRGPALAIEFTLAIAEYLKGEVARKDLEDDILYSMLMNKK